LKATLGNEGHVRAPDFIGVGMEEEPCLGRHDDAEIVAQDVGREMEADTVGDPAVLKTG
jgi:hypothetical protein